jgi:hypothetical protein
LVLLPVVVALRFLRSRVVAVFAPSSLSAPVLAFVGLWAVFALLLWVRLCLRRWALLAGGVPGLVAAGVAVSFVPGGVVFRCSPRRAVPVAARLLALCRLLGVPAAAVSFPASAGGGVSVFAAPWLGALLCCRAFRSARAVGCGVVWGVL